MLRVIYQNKVKLLKPAWIILEAKQRDMCTAFTFALLPSYIYLFICFRKFFSIQIYLVKRKTDVVDRFKIDEPSEKEKKMGRTC